MKAVPLHLFILEDNPGDRVLLVQYLQLSQLPVGSVIETHSLATATEALCQQRPDLIFLDLFLPDSAGLHTFTAINNLVPNVPIVVLSGISDSETALRAIQLGAQDYLIKGEFDEKLLAKTVSYSIERKRVQERLNQSLEMHELVGDATNDVIWDYNLATGQIVHLSKAIETNFRYPATALSNDLAWWQQQVHPDDVSSLQQKLVDTLAAHHTNGAHEFRFKTGGGEYRQVYARARVLYASDLADAPPQRIIGVLQDVTPLKKAEEKLSWSMQRYEAISKATSDVVYEWDIANDQVLFHEEDLKKVFGFTQSNAKSLQWWLGHMHPDDRKSVEHQLARQLEQKASEYFDEFRMQCTDGTYKYIYGKGYFFFTPDLKPVRMIGALQDVTELKALQEKVNNEKIDSQRRITEATIQSQEQEREELGRELHDNINQILATTKMFIDISIKNDSFRDELLPKSFTYLNMAIEELRKLSKSLVPPSLGDIGLDEAINELLHAASETTAIAYRFQNDAPANENLPLGIQLMLYRIVQEQLNNIHKYAKATSVLIEMESEKNFIKIRITDNGVGFNAAKKTKGIGLRNIRSRAELHGGKMDIVTAPGKGCSLQVSIPVRTRAKHRSKHYEKNNRLNNR